MIPVNWNQNQPQIPKSPRTYKELETRIANQNGQQNGINWYLSFDEGLNFPHVIDNTKEENNNQNMQITKEQNEYIEKHMAEKIKKNEYMTGKKVANLYERYYN